MAGAPPVRSRTQSFEQLLLADARFQGMRATRFIIGAETAEAGKNQSGSHEHGQPDEARIEGHGQNRADESECADDALHLPVEGQNPASVAFDGQARRDPRIRAALDHDGTGQTGSDQFLGGLRGADSGFAKNVDGLFGRLQRADQSSLVQIMQWRELRAFGMNRFVFASRAHINHRQLGIRLPKFCQIGGFDQIDGVRLHAGTINGSLAE